MSKEERIQEIRERLSKATKGPYKIGGYHGEHEEAGITITAPDGRILADTRTVSNGNWPEYEANAALFANSWADIEFLLSELPQTVKILKALPELLADYAEVAKDVDGNLDQYRKARIKRMNKLLGEVAVDRVLALAPDLDMEQAMEIAEPQTVAETTMAHCNMCHEIFPASEVKFQKSGADICPKCKDDNSTCIYDGHFECATCPSPIPTSHSRHPEAMIIEVVRCKDCANMAIAVNDVRHDTSGMFGHGKGKCSGTWTTIAKTYIHSLAPDTKLLEALETIAAWPFDIRGDCVADAKRVAESALTSYRERK